MFQFKVTRATRTDVICKQHPSARPFAQIIHRLEMAPKALTSVIDPFAVRTLPRGVQTRYPHQVEKHGNMAALTT